MSNNERINRSIGLWFIILFDTLFICLQSIEIKKTGITFMGLVYGTLISAFSMMFIYQSSKLFGKGE